MWTDKMHRLFGGASSLLSLICVLVLHTPGGTELHFDTRHVAVWQPLPKDYTGAAPGSKTVVNANGQRFFVVETVAEIEEQRDRCGEE